MSICGGDEFFIVIKMDRDDSDRSVISIAELLEMSEEEVVSGGDEEQNGNVEESGPPAKKKKGRSRSGVKKRSKKASSSKTAVKKSSKESAEQLEENNDGGEEEQNGDAEESGPPAKKKKGRSSSGVKKGDKKASSSKTPAKVPSKGSRSSSRPRKPVQRHQAEEVTDEDGEYEVEKILEMRKRRGERQFLIKWKGYHRARSTWEPEQHLSCKDLIKEFKEREEEEEEEYEVEKLLKVRSGKKGREFLVKWKGYGLNDASWEPEAHLSCKDLIKAFKEKEEEYEVEKLLKVRSGKKGREFLVKWKGYSRDDASWEPEAHLSCKELIKSFQEKEEEYEVEKLLEVRTRRGVREFLVKWKGFSKAKSTWEPESNLKASKELINEFLAKEKEEEKEEEEYEVVKILDMRKMKGGRAFQVQWKGYKQPTWEPEANLSCSSLIKEFLAQNNKNGN
ncbi:Chromobox protein 5 [Orchesella cincta]|uniref:Chromobox protein 5 n=1 Tax=Orchesella cincta TaxID=48709 RepID=A0A1D2M705_ORCCI|nr:Chromobox protein 5 [Orchesella cincta]